MPEQEAQYSSPKIPSADETYFPEKVWIRRWRITTRRARPVRRRINFAYFSFGHWM